MRSALVIDLPRKRKEQKSPTLQPPLVSHLLATAEQWQLAIDRGDVRNRAALARRERRSQVYVGRLLDLLRLHPDIRTAIAELPPGTPERFVTERKLRPLTRLPWERQLAELGWLLRKRRTA